MKVNVFLPKYIINFKCINSSCGDTCCAGWDINIDEYTYKKYENSNGKLKALTRGKYIKNNEEHEFFNHGFMILKDENRCPFLNCSMLCDIHGETGEKNLCITCKSYPRVFNLVDDVYEKSGLASCEEICVRAFLNKEKMEFVEEVEDIDESNIEIRRIVDSEAFEGTENLLQYFWDIRIASINIMQSRNFTIEERLNILKNFYKLIEMKDKSKDYNEVEEILEEFNDGSEKYYQYKGEEFKENNEFYFSLARDVLENNIKSFRLKECIKEYKNGISNKKDIAGYIELEPRFSYQLRNYSYIFENYLVNQIFKDLIPFNKGGHFTESLTVLINSYKIIKAYILGIALNSNKEINEKHIIRVIQALSKDIEHSKVFKELLERV